MRPFAGYHNTGWWVVFDRDTGMLLGKYLTPEELLDRWGGVATADLSRVEDALSEEMVFTNLKKEE